MTYIQVERDGVPLACARRLESAREVNDHISLREARENGEVIVRFCDLRVLNGNPNESKGLL